MFVCFGVSDHLEILAWWECADTGELWETGRNSKTPLWKDGMVVLGSHLLPCRSLRCILPGSAHGRSPQIYGLHDLTVKTEGGLHGCAAPISSATRTGDRTRDFCGSDSGFSVFCSFAASGEVFRWAMLPAPERSWVKAAAGPPRRHSIAVFCSHCGTSSEAS